MRYALLVEYQGTAYAGWQRQPHAPSIQQTLEQTLSQIANEPIQVVCAGRTDTGVHAKGQVVHFDTQAVRPIYNWVRGLNAMLPNDIAIQSMSEVSPEFHARFSASFRRYQYRILNQEQRSPLWDKRATFIHTPLNVSAMHEAGLALLGYHDFNAFRSSECQSHSSHRHVLSIAVRAEGPWVIMDISANAFLHHMVRNIMGSLLWVGSGKTSVQWMYDILNAKDRTQAGPTAPAEGLYFCEVGYPHDIRPNFAKKPNDLEDFGYHLGPDSDSLGTR
jgi:tRNA pseudouridine38-40 synthase